MLADRDLVEQNSGECEAHLPYSAKFSRGLIFVDFVG